MIPAARQRGVLLALCAAFVVLGAVYSVATPLFEAPDEVWHFAHVRYVAQHGSLPVQGALQGEQAARQEASQPPLYYLLAAPLIRWLDTGDFDATARLNPHAAPGLPESDGNKNMVLATAAPLPWHGTALAVHILRLFSLLLGLSTILSTYALGRAMWSGTLPLLLAALVAFNPQFLFISASINNDNLMTALAALALALVARSAKAMTPVSTRRAAVLGVIAGLAAITKLTGVLLLAFLIIACCLIAWRQPGVSPSGRLRSLAAPSGVVVTLAAVIAGWWYARNWLLYGDLTGLRPMLAWVGERSLSLSQLPGELQGLELSFWAVFGWFNILADEWVYTALKIVGRLAGLGLAVALLRWLLARRSRKTPPPAVHLHVLALASLWAGIVLAGLVRWTATTPGAQGRLLFPAIGALAALLLAGLSALVPLRLRAPVLTALVGGLLVLAVIAPFRYVMPAYARPAVVTIDATPPQHAARLTYGDGEIEILGYDLDRQTALPGEQVAVTLYLRVLRPMSQDYSLFMHLWGRDGERVGQRDSYPGRGSLPTSQMTPGAIIADRYLVSIAPTATVPARVQIEVGFFDYTTGRLLPAAAPDGTGSGMPIVGRFKLASPSAGDRSLRPALFSFGEQVNLVSAQTETPPMVRARSVITVSTLWQATAAMQQDYTVFMQVVDDKPAVIAQNDGQPRSGEYPTGLWDVGEVVADQRTLTLPGSLPAGRYRVVTGLYLLATGERLYVRSTSGPVPENWAVICEFTVP